MERARDGAPRARCGGRRRGRARRGEGEAWPLRRACAGQGASRSRRTLEPLRARSTHAPPDPVRQPPRRRRRRGRSRTASACDRSPSPASPRDDTSAPEPRRQQKSGAPRRKRRTGSLPAAARRTRRSTRPRERRASRDNACASIVARPPYYTEISGGDRRAALAGSLPTATSFAPRRIRNSQENGATGRRFPPAARP
jgi:hypothetical protein